MIPLSIFRNAEEMALDIADPIVDCTGLDMRVGFLTRGTTSGKPTVSMFFKLPDGRYAFFQTTVALFLSAADVFKAIEGDPRK